jgi:hypothetical protein
MVYDLGKIRYRNILSEGVIMKVNGNVKVKVKELTSDGTFLSIDSSLFVEVNHLTLGMGEATKYRENPVIKNTPGGPDEYRAGMPYAPWVLAENGHYRMWYTAFDGKEWFTCYAQSSDGYHWEKPSLGLVEYKGSKQNNIVHAGFELMGVFRDDTEPEVKKRYKASVYGDITEKYFNDEAKKRYSFGTVHPGLRTFAYSPDGFTWQLDPEIDFPIREKIEDGTLYRMDDRRWFMAHQMNCGQYPQVDPQSRFVAISYSDDFKHWTLAPEPGFYFKNLGDAVQTHVTPGYINYGNVIVGIQGIFLNHSEVYHQETDLTVVLTNDGFHWRQPIPEQPFTYFLRRGDRGRWDESFIVQGNLVNVGDKTLLFYSGSHYGNASNKDMQIGIAEIRRDGYGYLAPQIGWNSAQEEYEGFLITQPIRLLEKGLVLSLNIKGAGRNGEKVTVELQDETGLPLNGFTASDCDPIVDDGIQVPVTWRGKSRLDFPAGKKVRVKIFIKGINPQKWELARIEIPRLYAFYFQKD